MTTHTETSGTLPTHRLYSVIGTGESANWTPIGAAWANKDGKGFSLSCDAHSPTRPHRDARHHREASVDFILTDPPYLVNYRPRSGQQVANDNDDAWLNPAYAGMHRVLKNGGLCVSFYGWTKAELFIEAWRAAGFRMMGYISFIKHYASSKGMLRSRHEMAYLLAEGTPPRPEHPIPDVIDFPYTGNRLHPTQKPVPALRPLIECFTTPGQLVLDPFCGSGSTLVAAQMSGRDWLGIDLEAGHCRTARKQMR